MLHTLLHSLVSPIDLLAKNLRQMGGGFFISCLMNREERGFKEFAERAGLLTMPDHAVEIGPGTDFRKELGDEVRLLKSQKRFAKLEEYKSFVLVSNHSDEQPSKLVQAMRRLGYSFTNVLRVLPLDIVTKYDEDKIAAYINANKFEGSYKIMFEGRLCDAQLKNKCFELIVPLIPCKVSLDAPDYVVLIQAFKSIVGLSVVPNDPNNFNFSS
ncbi:hypothetical protein PAPHI01_0755 [Pancytospora philotis]|nr:hypothetical protein PAPHI01_0755 [Pancytospora philotis]